MERVLKYKVFCIKNASKQNIAHAGLAAVAAAVIVVNADAHVFVVAVRLFFVVTVLGVDGCFFQAVVSANAASVAVVADFIVALDNLTVHVVLLMILFLLLWMFLLLLLSL